MTAAKPRSQHRDLQAQTNQRRVDAGKSLWADAEYRRRKAAGRKRERQATKHVHIAVANTLEGLGVFECVEKKHLGLSTKDLEAAKKAFQKLILSLRKRAEKIEG